MKQTEKTVNQITEGIIWKQLLYFFFPILLGTFFQQLYNTADAMVVGRFVGKEALACVGGSSSQIINLIVGFFVGLSSGATVIIAQYYGARDEKNLQDTLHTAIAFSIVGSFVISILGIVLSPIILRLMNTPEYLMADSLLYLRFYFGGIIFIFIYNIGSGILRAVGDSKNPLYFLIFCCFCNIFLDLLLVMVFHMGVLGVALGTLISQALSSVLILRNLMRTKDIYRLELRKIRLHAAPLSMLLKIGLPSGLQSTMYNIANMVIQTALNSFGTDTMAAWTAFGKVDSFYWMISSAFGVAITTFVGQNYGAGKIDRMKKSVRVCFCMDLATALTLSALMYLFLGKFLLSLFTTDAEDHCPCLCALRLHRDLLRSTSRSRQCADPHAPDLRRYLRHPNTLDLLLRSESPGCGDYYLLLPRILGTDSDVVYFVFCVLYQKALGARRD